MIESIKQLLGTLDQKVLIAILVVLAILLVIALIKKLVKMAVFIIALMLVWTFVLPIAKEYQEKYNFRIIDNVAMITVDGKDISLDKEACDGIKFNGKSDTSDNYSISIILDGENVEFEVPKFIQDGIEKFAKSSDIKIES